MGIVIAVTLGCMMSSLIWFPLIRMERFQVQTYWVITVIGALLVWGLQDFALSFLQEAWAAEGLINPIRILGLFFAFTVLAIFLDEVGLIKYLAYLAVKHAGRSQSRLFLIWFIVVALATMLTANDIVILTLTPFIIYLARHAKVSPLPYLMSQFVSANTWSMALVIGNPTNIYLASMFEIGFLNYLQVMIMPTLITGLVSFLLLYLMFNRLLRKPIQQPEMVINLPHSSYRFGIIMLAFAIIAMAFAPWLNVSMDGVTMIIAALFLVGLWLGYRRQPYPAATLKKLPYTFIPFFLSMAILVKGLDTLGLTTWFADWLIEATPLYRVGISSFVLSNVINNIPMSLWFGSVLQAMPQGQLLWIYSAIIGSNLGAIFTPVGALAGLMWLSILKAKQVNFHFATFLSFGVVLGPMLLLVALWMLDVFSR